MRTEENNSQGDKKDSSITNPVPQPEEGGEKSVTELKADQEQKSEPNPESENVREKAEPASVKPSNQNDSTPDNADAHQNETAEVNDKAVEKSEDISEESDDNENHEDDREDVDYSNFELKDIIKALEEARHEHEISKITKVLDGVSQIVLEMVETERKEALEKFLEEGGEKDDFHFRSNEELLKAESLVAQLRDMRTRHYAELAEQKGKNYEIKNQLLKKLRDLVDGDETTASIKDLKDLQEQWKSTGPVPHQHNKTLWANYHALLDRYYDNRSIYFELKELDRKKNLKAKEELVNRAEELLKMETIKDAVQELNSLHEEFRHIGPVPKEVQEDLWQRFKSASDAVYAKRRNFVEELKKELEQNLEKKQAIIEKAKTFAEFSSDSIKEWNKTAKDVVALQKEWEGVGGVPRKRAKEVNKEFWGAFKSFFGAKNNFFKELDKQREGNLKRKQQLVEKAKELIDNEDWKSTAEALKRLQQDWKAIGPVPDKYRESVFKEFKAVCDGFFESRRKKLNHEAESFQDNYTKKKELCDKITLLATENPSDVDGFVDLVNAYNDLGYVPKNKIRESQQDFDAATKVFLDKTNMEPAEKENLRIEVKIGKLASGPNADRKIKGQQQAIRKEISKIEEDISLWKNNLEFFASSKTADKLRKEFDEKIAKAEAEISTLKKQLKLLRDA